MSSTLRHGELGHEALLATVLTGDPGDLTAVAQHTTNSVRIEWVWPHGPNIEPTSAHP
jgi:hypothetical protein